MHILAFVMSLTTLSSASSPSQPISDMGPNELANRYDSEDARGFEDTDGAGRWDRAPQQLWSAAGGGFMGILVGGGVGLLAGAVYGVSQDKNCSSNDGLCGVMPLAMGVVGMGFGALAGLPIGMGVEVSKSAPSAYPSAGVVPGILGATLGFASGIGLGFLTRSPETGGIGALVGAELGALTLDRITSRSPGALAVSGWSPRPGVLGARWSMAY